MRVHIILHMQHENYNKVNMRFDDVKLVLLPGRYQTQTRLAFRH